MVVPRKLTVSTSTNVSISASPTSLKFDISAWHVTHYGQSMSVELTCQNQVANVNKRLTCGMTWLSMLVNVDASNDTWFFHTNKIDMWQHLVRPHQQEVDTSSDTCYHMGHPHHLLADTMSHVVTCDWAIIVSSPVNIWPVKSQLLASLTRARRHVECLRPPLVAIFDNATTIQLQFYIKNIDVLKLIF